MTHKSRERRKYGTCTRREMLAGCGSALAASLAGLQLGCSRARTGLVTPNIIVFLADALRADHLGCYGYGRATSPRIDEMAKSSIVFENCYSQAPWTKPSIGSMFTGLLPPVHQAVLTTWDIAALVPENPDGHKMQMLRDDFDILARNLEHLGYQTALFQSNPHCQKEFGFAQGFQHYRYKVAEPPEEQVNAVLEWFQQEADASTPFFVFVHEVDPHGPYVPTPSIYHELFGQLPEQSAARLTKDDLELLDGFNMRYVSNNNFQTSLLGDLSPAGLDHLISLYDGEIRGVDFHFGRLLDYLARTGLDDNTVVVFLSDHGEAFGEHGFFAHNCSLYDEELHVPMIIRLGGKGRGMRVPWNTNLYALFPTLTSLAGGEYDDAVQSRALLTPDGHAALDSDRPVLAYHDRNRPDRRAWQFCVVQDGYKVYDKPYANEIEIYDRKKDPAEKVNLYGTIPESENLVKRARDLREKHLALSKEFGEAELVGADEDTLEGLRALGYL